MNTADSFDKGVWRDAFGMIVGSFIGEGAYRKVYASCFDPTEVIKIEVEAGHFANVKEWEIWNQVQYGPLAKWFAPCYRISPNGILLSQARTTPASRKDMPKKVPGFITDLKPMNWGWYKDRVVCHDYGNILIGSGSKLKNANWTGVGYA